MTTQQRPPLYTLSGEELQEIVASGNDQERHLAKLVLAMRANADNPRATVHPSQR